MSVPFANSVVAVWAAGSLALLLAQAAGATTLTATSDILLPKFSKQNFDQGAPVTNRYFPLRPGARTVLRGVEEDDDGEEIEVRSVLMVLQPGQAPQSKIKGIKVTTQLDKAFEGGLLVEKTFDYYAQDRTGNVWYMGEDVTNFIYDDDDNLIETNDESAWIAGKRGAKPGWIMPADPVLGLRYYQEFAEADDALDAATIFALDRTVTIGLGTFKNVLQTFETSELDPDAREFKFYAPGIGIILEHESLDEGLGNPEVVAEAVAISPVPVPAGLPLLLGGLGALALAGRRLGRAASRSRQV